MVKNLWWQWVRFLELGRLGGSRTRLFRSPRSSIAVLYNDLGARSGRAGSQIRGERNEPVFSRCSAGCGPWMNLGTLVKADQENH